MLSARPLKRCQISRMFPVLAQVLPDMTLKDWTALAGRIIRRSEADGEAGAIVIENDNATIRGCFIYEIETQAGGKRRLVVRHVVIPPLGQTMVAKVIHAAVEDIARTQACDFVHVELPTDAAWETDFFIGHGHQVLGIDIGHTTPSS